MRRGDFILVPYLNRSNCRATWQILSTVLPIIGLWIIISKIDQTGLSGTLKAFQLLPVLGLLILLSSRTFSLMHDCGHGSLFRSQWLNRITGFLLGALNAIPQHPWSRGHAFHHKHNGNWELYRGPSAVITLKEYQALANHQKLLYGISRHPLMLFPGGFFYLIIKPRLTLILGLIEFGWSLCHDLFHESKKSGFNSFKTLPSKLLSHKSNYWYTKGELLDLLANNVLVIYSWYCMSKWLGIGLFWTCYSFIMTISAAIFICVFFVQHNFEDSYAHRTNDWKSLPAATEGSSNLNVPRWLNWFFADISFHSVHHLCYMIPNYRLRACHIRNQQLLKNAKILTISDIPKCFKYVLWDSEKQILTTLKEARKITSPVLDL